MTVKTSISALFDNSGIKIVSNTDKSKQAYVVNKAQRSVFWAAGKKPDSGSFQIHILGDDKYYETTASYYDSKRVGSNRPRPFEPRMGLDFIGKWLSVGDELLLANIGSEIFAVKLNDNNLVDRPVESLREKVFSHLSDESIKARARAASKKPQKKKNSTEVYVRDPYIIEFAKRRAGGKCEMPGCAYKAFMTESGVPYLEGHHVMPLGEEGEDTIKNIVALCPSCHREQHYSKDKFVKRAELRKALDKILARKR